MVLGTARYTCHVADRHNVVCPVRAVGGYRAVRADTFVTVSAEELELLERVVLARLRELAGRRLGRDGGHGVAEQSNLLVRSVGLELVNLYTPTYY